MEASSSSKVTVEYHDPSGIFPLISRDLAARLPLKNLSWQSHARPLRQIKSLHVDFVPDKPTQTSLQPPATNDEGPNSIDIVGAGGDRKRNAAEKERRHQIPGLKTSPYLRIYVLRCDDKDTYKASERQKVREWIRDTAEGKREKHDACEWMVLHVVVPDTVAASEPRWRESSRDPDELKERTKSVTTWPGKSSRTVFDKLRADINETSKNSPDRIAQIRLLKKDVPPDLLPTPAIAQTLGESAQERENAWADLVAKLKSLILLPFDARVRQYEEDIAEQEARRSLPGWNFCTFFIHKEGLAKALESIGLVEDALAIYDELTVGLEMVVRDIASGNAEGTATSFASTTTDIKERIIGNAKDTGKAPSLFDKDYRVEIVRSEISVFDFCCYMFSRQKALILRLAGAQLARSEFGNNFKEGGEDLVLLAELNGSESNKLSPSDLESLVSSWTFALADQVLAEADTALLGVDGTNNGAIANASTKLQRPDFGFAMGANMYPSRTTSLPGQTRGGPQSFAGGDVPKVVDKPGLPELAAYRAELVMIKRRTLEHLAEKRGWVAGWNSTARSPTAMNEVDLDADESGEESHASDEQEAETGSSHTSSALTAKLAVALADSPSFLTTFENLSTLAVRLYTAATHAKSAETIMGDIAMLKFQQCDFTEAARYFEYVLPLYASDSWSLQEARVVRDLAECFKQLNRKGDYAQVVLNILKKVARRRIDGKKGSGDAEVSAEEYLKQLVTASADLPTDLDARMDDFFDDIELGREIGLLEDKDGFSYQFGFRHVLDDLITFDEISVKLVRVDDPQTEIVVTKTAPLEVQTGSVHVELESNSTTFGAYYIDKIILKAKRLQFVHDLRPPTIPETSALGIVYAPSGDEERNQRERPFVLLYPHVRAFEASARLAKSVHMEKTKHLEIKLNSGMNDIQSIDLKLKPASAGLRLYLGDAETTGIDRRNDKEPKVGILALDSIAPEQEAILQIPYTMDHAISKIVVRLEAHYSTAAGNFCFCAAVKLPAMMPLDVNVTDLFRHDALFSTFTARTTDRSPLVVTNAELSDSKLYAVETPSVSVLPTMVLDKSPLSLLYKITRKSNTEAVSKFAKKDAALSLAVQYQSVEELILASLSRTFAADIESSEFKHLRRLLVPVLQERARQRILPSDLDRAALLGQAKVPSFADLGWFEIVDTLSSATQRALSDWLMKWHIEHSRIDINLPTQPTNEDKCLSLAVEVPNVDIAFSVSVALLEPGLAGEAGMERVVKLGQPTPAELKISYARGWSTKAILGTQQGDQGEKSNDFFLDVQAEPETWVVAGSRRKHFTLPSVSTDDGADQVFTFPIVLVPLQLGSHPLPQLDVQAAKGDEVGEAGKTPPIATCETFCESAGVVVRVVKGLQRSRIKIVEGTESAV
ncbi:hypothetical protein MBLNU13_g04797t3 [Cladosporium sp. NU13]